MSLWFDLPQSALHPAGRSAQQIAELFWWMTIAGALIWLVVFGIAVYSTRPNREIYSSRVARWLIIGGGVIFPTVVLTILLASTLGLVVPLRDAGNPDLRIAVSGEQWWWRVRYLPGADQNSAGEPVELANEIRLPVGKRAEFILSSPDVIHSFWIPSLGGKMDMIPGRITTLILEPTKPGVYRGACAEYCGSSHALMNFAVVVTSEETFGRWLHGQSQPAQTPTDPLAQRGLEAFLANGCGACHSIRGTPADGAVGPDLTHVGSRLTVGAGILPTDPDSFHRWIGHTQAIKPDVRMPAFGMLPEEQLTALAAYLSGLQ